MQRIHVLEYSLGSESRHRTEGAVKGCVLDAIHLSSSTVMFAKQSDSRCFQNTGYRGREETKMVSENKI